MHNPDMTNVYISLGILIFEHKSTEWYTGDWIDDPIKRSEQYEETQSSSIDYLDLYLWSQIETNENI